MDQGDLNRTERVIMQQDNHSNYTSHNDVWLLLPWHVNGSLNENERPLVEKHIKICVTCRREVENLTKLSTELAYSETIDLAADASFSQLKKQIQLPQEPSDPTVINNPLSWIRGWLLSRHNLAGVPLILVTVVTASAFFWQYNTVGVEPGAEYYTLSNEKVGELGRKAIRVEFAEDVTQNRIEQIIASIDGTVLDESSHNRVYHVRIQNSQVNGFKHLTAVVARLQAHSDVVSARPIGALKAQN